MKDFPKPTNLTVEGSEMVQGAHPQRLLSAKWHDLMQSNLVSPEHTRVGLEPVGHRLPRDSKLTSYSHLVYTAEDRTQPTTHGVGIEFLFRVLRLEEYARLLGVDHYQIIIGLNAALHHPQIPARNRAKFQEDMIENAAQYVAFLENVLHWGLGNGVDLKFRVALDTELERDPWFVRNYPSRGGIGTTSYLQRRDASLAVIMSQARKENPDAFILRSLRTTGKKSVEEMLRDIGSASGRSHRAKPEPADQFTDGILTGRNPSDPTSAKELFGRIGTIFSLAPLDFAGHPVNEGIIAASEAGTRIALKRDFDPESVIPVKPTSRKALNGLDSLRCGTFLGLKLMPQIFAASSNALAQEKELAKKRGDQRTKNVTPQLTAVEIAYYKAVRTMVIGQTERALRTLAPCKDQIGNASWRILDLLTGSKTSLVSN